MVGFHKFIIIFSFLGGISIFMMLGAGLWKFNLQWILAAVLALVYYICVAETNMMRDGFTGQKGFQDIHIMFTLAFAPFVYTFY